MYLLISDFVTITLIHVYRGVKRYNEKYIKTSTDRITKAFDLVCLVWS